MERRGLDEEAWENRSKIRQRQLYETIVMGSHYYVLCSRGSVEGKQFSFFLNGAKRHCYEERRGIQCSHAGYVYVRDSLFIS